MAAHKIAVIPGDGIGQEVMPEGLKVLRAMQETTPGLELALRDLSLGLRLLPRARLHDAPRRPQDPRSL